MNGPWPWWGWLLAVGGTLLVLRIALGFILARRRYFPLRDKVVVVTGGSRGLGLAMVRQLVAEGAKVALCARDKEELGRAVASLPEGSNVFPLAADLRDRGQVVAMLRAARDRLGPIDVLINNAGVIQVGPHEEMTAADFDDVLATNYQAALTGILEVLPEMQQRRSGRIVNVSSLAGVVPVPHMLTYTASKFALAGLSSGLRLEAARHGVYVVTICPGVLRTGSPEHAQFKGRNEAEYTWFSLNASAPFVTITGESAARRIIRATVNGTAFTILTWPAHLLATFYVLMPNAASIVLSWGARLMPSPGGIGTDIKLGKESHVAVSPSPLTALGNAAAERLNQYAPGEGPGAAEASAKTTEAAGTAP